MAVGDKIQLRQGPSGTFLEGTADNDVPLWDNTRGLWGAGALPPSVAFRNLTLTAYVDNGAPAPTTPDGNIEQPFTTFDDAQITNPSVIYVAPGNYLGEGTISFIPPGCTVYGIGDAPGRGTFPLSIFMCPLLPELDFSPPPGDNEFFFQNVRLTIAGASGFVDSITLRNCYTTNNEGSAYALVVEGGVFQGSGGGGSTWMRNVDLILNVSLDDGASFNRFENCTVETGLNFQFANPGGVLQIDTATAASMHLATSTVVDGGVRVLDGPAVQAAFGALNSTTTEFLNPWDTLGNTAASAAARFITTDTRRFAHTIRATLAAAHTDDVVVTLHTGATLGALAPTALTVTIPAGNLSATFDLDTTLEVVAAGTYMAVDFVSAANLAANALEVLVGLS